MSSVDCIADRDDTCARTPRCRSAPIQAARDARARLRLDYIFASEDFHFEQSAADRYPLVADLVLQR